MANDTQVGGISVPIEADIKPLEKGLKQGELATEKTAKEMDKHLIKMAKSFSTLAKNVDKSMKDINKSMETNLSHMDAGNKRMMDRLLAMQSSNTKAISRQTSMLKNALNSLHTDSTAGLEKVGNQIKNHKGYYDSLIGKFRSLAVNVWIATQAIESLGNTIVSVFKPGFQFVKEMETMELGTAGILTSMTKLNGQDMEWNSALAISKDLMGKIANDALVTVSTTEELARVFQSVLAPAISAGWNLDQTREFAKVGSNAVKAIGLPAQQVVQELRDLVMGGIRASSSTLAASMGVTDALVNQWKASGQLYDKLMERMVGFNRAAKETQNTFMGLISNIQDGIQRVSAQGLQTTFAEAKKELQSIQSLFFDIVPVMKEIDGKMVEVGQTATFNNKTLALYYELSLYVVESWRSFKKLLEDHKGTIDSILGLFKTLLYNVEKIGELFIVLFATQSRWKAVITSLVIVLEKFDLLEKVIQILANNIELLITILEIRLVSAFVTSSTVAVARLYMVRSAALALGSALGIVVATLGTILFMGSQIAKSKATQGAVENELNQWGVSLPKEESPAIPPQGMGDMRQSDQFPVASSVNPTDKITSKFPPAGDSKGAKAANRAAIAQLKADLAEYLENLKAFQKELDYKKQENLISIKEYWAETLRVTQDGLKEEIRVLEIEKQFANDEAALYNMEKDIKKKKVQLAESVIEVKRKEAKEMRAFNNELLKVQSEYITMFGLEQSISLGIDPKKLFKTEAAEQYRDSLMKVNEMLKYAKAEKVVDVNKVNEYEMIKKALEAQVQYTSFKKLTDNQQTDYNNKLSEQNRLISQYNDEVKMGTKDELATIPLKKAAIDAKLNASRQFIIFLESEEIPAAVKATEAYKRMLAEAKEGYRKLQIEAKNTGILTRDFLESQMTQAFTGMIMGTQSVADAFKNMANAIISEILRIVVVQRLVNGVLKMFGFSGGGSVGGSTGPTSTPMPTFANGGPIYGAGTSTSDSIPAMLSNEEFVIKASSARKIGLPKLNYINNMGALPKFAVGGSVGSSKNTSSDTFPSEVKVQIFNETNQPMQITQSEAKFDGVEYVVSAWLKGVQSNTMGLGTMMRGQRR